MADITLGSTNDVATLMAGPEPYTATNTFSVKGYLYNVGKRKAWIATHGNDNVLQEIQRVGSVGLPPGMAIPLKVNRFSFATEKGYTILLWLPGDSPPVYTLALVQGENGLVVQDANTAQALKDLAAQIGKLIGAYGPSVK